MSRQVQIIRGTTEQNDNFTGATGALTYDTDTKGLRVHDGSTQGGFEVPTAAMADYVIYWDSGYATDHSHAKPGVATPTTNTWYRYYKSGWVEQGGYVGAASPSATVSLPVTMADVSYNALFTLLVSAGAQPKYRTGVVHDSITTTSFKVAGYGAADTYGKWFVAGYAA